MSSSQNNDSDERFALGLVFALITLVVLSVLWFGAYKGIHGAKAAKGGVVAAKLQPGASGAVLGGTASAGSAAATGAGDAAAQAGAAAGASASAASGAAAQAGAAADDAARVLIENGIVKFYFATAKADLAPGANEALVDVVAGVKAGQRAVISGYTDSTGDAEKNAELAKQRAFAVRDALVALGVAEDKLDLKKPEAVENAGNNAEARRVEVVLAK
ncbi:OmpA family protein [Comamonas odontotermitis]|uniref:OmpA family protein n=1 Tax=Comamonas odontotermitis TaxID=379895 RepID=UPI001CC7F391|nr:OmpA family protein [Comamonas odontotermitis]UBB16053.1 OmpA family protein [Comamonas odontotermitis]